MNITQTQENYERQVELSELRAKYLDRIRKDVYELMLDDVVMLNMADDYFTEQLFKTTGQKYNPNEHLVDQVHNFMDIIFYYEKHFKFGTPMIREIYYKKLNNLDTYMVKLALEGEK